MGLERNGKGTQQRLDPTQRGAVATGQSPLPSLYTPL